MPELLRTGVWSQGQAGVSQGACAIRPEAIPPAPVSQAFQLQVTVAVSFRGRKIKKSHSTGGGGKFAEQTLLLARFVKSIQVCNSSR
ncbi:hypothetical protein CDAR_222151 [Caerostris darwini]|uniref:Uncharacterized protein n=1 Tax=Caerostris darwini TaxID=1538125 RepID=A0AAV4P4Y2_9ARAC|nr:hypothetical protein CDAR_222151 [Caerostris darwini]